MGIENIDALKDDDDALDGCEIDFAEEADDEETAELRALFPEGVADNRWEGVNFSEP
jgi:hypothetical protein